MDEIDIYNNQSIILMRKTPPKIISWITIIIATTIIFLFISIFYKYNDYLYYNGTVIKLEDKYYVQLYVEEDKISEVSNSSLINNNKIIKYKIFSISPTSYLTDKGYNVREILLEYNISDKFKIENNILDLRFKLPQTTMMNQLIKNIQKEMS